MFDLFGKRKSLKEMMNELDEIMGSFNHEFSSITNEESQSNEGSDKNGEWKTETYTSPNGMFRYVITTVNGTPYKKYPKETDEISLLEKELQDCVEKQKFERALRLETRLKILKKTKMKLKIYKPNWMMQSVIKILNRQLNYETN